MRSVVQRVNWARVTVDGQVIGAIERGLCALVGVTHGDDERAAVKLADKLWHLRVFDDASVGDVGGAVLVVSQFTLYGDTTKGRRPSWIAAAPPEQAEPLIEVVVDRLRHHGAQVATGRFRAHMLVELENDGPVTVLLDV